MKVWGTYTWFSRNKETMGSQCRAIIASKTKKEAMEALEQSAYTFKNYTAQTFNDVELKVALADPGVVYECHNSNCSPLKRTYKKAKKS
jgi:hypothetical protein